MSLTASQYVKNFLLKGVCVMNKYERIHYTNISLMWMDLEIIILTEVRMRKTNIYLYVQSKIYR